MARILIIDTSRGIRNTLRERLEYEKYEAESAASSEEALEVLAHFRPDLVLCDSYSDLIRQLNCPFIVLSEDNSVENAVETVKAGAWDFIPKPINMNHLLVSIRKATENSHNGASGHTTILPTIPAPKHISGVQPIIGHSAVIAHVKKMIDKVAPSEARVMIMGDNGTGKELVAQWLHEKSNRKRAPFVEVNCAAIPSELIESELFGHEKGAFTSAVKQRKGKFEQAHEGTLFLDEIGDMSLSAQAKVLRALQEHRISRVGSDKDIAVDVRVIAATNKNLKEEIEKGNFREDLYHRLSVIIIHVPPLSERREDIPELVSHFTGMICNEYGIAVKKIASAAIEELKKMPWTGNIRELRNVVERLIILGGDTISSEDVRTYAETF